jgi:hypothetical protein
MRRFLFAAVCWATVGLVGARADVIYRYITDKTSFEGVNVGDKIAIPILLQETLTGTSTSKIFADGGVFGAGVIVNSPGGAIFGSSGTLNDFKIAPNVLLQPAGFAFGTPPAPSQVDASPATKNQAGLIVNAEINQGPNFSNAGSATTTPTRSILIGTVNVVVGASPTTLTITRYTGSSNTITMTGADLDNGTQAVDGYIGTSKNPLGDFSFTVGQVIPEPSSMALCGLIACGMSYAGYRRRNNKSAEPVTVG